MDRQPFITWRSELPSALILGAVAVFAAYFSGRLPERVATHWNLAGEPNGWSSRGFVVWFFPALILFVYLLMLVIWRLDPKRERYVEFARAYHGVKLLIVTFLAGVFAVICINGMDLVIYGIAIDVPVGFAMPPLLGLLFVGIGAHLPDIKQNWLFGIRTPWTLSSEKVWDRTHRLAGYLFVFAGALTALTAFLPGAFGMAMLLGAVGIAAIVPLAYSYVLYSLERSTAT